MEQYQKVIVNLLKSSIDRKKIKLEEENSACLNKVINESKQHEISSLVYSSIDRNSFKFVDNDVLNEWRQKILKENLIQIQNINSIAKLIEGLDQQGIEIILLKGLVLRNFYPRPEYRTMCDADILIKPEDYLVVKNYLIKNGCKCYENNHPIHAGFMCSNQLYIEVHWKLINDAYLNESIKNFEKDIWKRAIEFNICGVKCKTLCNEDFLMHMCFHMAVHAKYKGFGLRQLYDMAVFIKNKNIDWTSFDNKISLYGISKFIKGIFELLNKIFDIDIQENILTSEFVNEQEIQLLLTNIFAAGVHGEKEEIDGFKQLCWIEANQQYVSTNIKKLFRFIFPTRSLLSHRYKYAKENSLLLPIAWIHHAIRGIFIRKYGVVKIIKYYKVTLDIINKRKKLIKTFEL